MSPELAARRTALLKRIDDFGTQIAFAKALGFNQSRISRALDPANVSDRRLAPIERALSKYDESRPARDGDPTAPPASPPLRLKASGGDLRAVVIGEGEEELVAIPTLDLSVSAGPGAEPEFETVQGHTHMPAWFVREQFGASPHRVFRLRVRGNSMRPTIEAGEHVYVVRLQPGQRPAHGGVYVLRSPHGLLIKRLFFDAVAEGTDADSVRYWVRIHSDNPEAGTDRIPLEVFERDYVALAVLSRIEKHL